MIKDEMISQIKNSVNSNIGDKAIYSYQKHIKVSIFPGTQNDFLSMDEDKVGSPTKHKLKGKNFG